MTVNAVRGNVWGAGLYAGISAVVINLVLYGVAVAAFDIPEKLGMNPVSVVIASLFGAFAGTLLYVGLSRFTANPDRLFQGIALVGLLLSLGGPISAQAGNMPDVPAIETGLMLVMIGMHIVAAATTVYFLTWGREAR